MLQTYINHINHNCYLKINFSNPYLYSKLQQISINIKFKNDINNKFYILCTFFLFKNILFKNGYFIILNKKSKKILGLKYILTNSLMLKFLEFLLTNFINQPEIQNYIKYNSFDKIGNYTLSLSNFSDYYFEKLVHNTTFKLILNKFNMVFVFHLTNKNILNHIFYLNLFKFYFNLNKSQG